MLILKTLRVGIRETEAHIRYRLEVENFEQAMAKKFHKPEIDDLAQSMRRLQVAEGPSSQARDDEQGLLDEQEPQAKPHQGRKGKKNKGKQEKKDDEGEAPADVVEQVLERKASPVLLAPRVREPIWGNVAGYLRSGLPVHHHFAAKLNQREARNDPFLLFEVTWDELMTMEWTAERGKSFESVYRNYLSPKQTAIPVGLPDIKLIILMRFLRFIKGIDLAVSEKLQGDTAGVNFEEDVVALITDAANKATDCLHKAEREQSDLTTSVGPFRGTHGEGESEHYIDAIVKTLAAISREIEGLSSKNYHLPVELRQGLYNLPLRADETPNVMLKAIIGGIDYLSRNYFLDYLAAALLKTHSAWNPLNYWYQGKKMLHSPIKAQTKREHCRATWSSLCDELFNTFELVEQRRVAKYPENSRDFWLRAAEVMRLRQESSESIKSTGGSNRLGGLYEALAREFNHCADYKARYSEVQRM